MAGWYCLPPRRYGVEYNGEIITKGARELAKNTRTDQLSYDKCNISVRFSPNMSPTGSFYNIKIFQYLFMHDTRYILKIRIIN